MPIVHTIEDFSLCQVDVKLAITGRNFLLSALPRNHLSLRYSFTLKCLPQCTPCLFYVCMIKIRNSTGTGRWFSGRSICHANMKTWIWIPRTSIKSAGIVWALTIPAPRGEVGNEPGGSWEVEGHLAGYTTENNTKLSQTEFVPLPPRLGLTGTFIHTHDCTHVYTHTHPYKHQ